MLGGSAGSCSSSGLSFVRCLSSTRAFVMEARSVRPRFKVYAKPFHQAKCKIKLSSYQKCPRGLLHPR